MTLNSLLHWWAAYPEIRIPASVCPASPEGQIQTAAAVIAPSDWQGLFNVGFWATASIALVAVLLTYWTRSMGERFRPRWWVGLVIAAALAALGCYLVVTSQDVNTVGCEFGETTTQIPATPALVRASVALVQGAIWFVLWSFVLTRAVRVRRWQPFYNNSRFPF
jgi:hypothetical protein